MNMASSDERGASFGSLYLHVPFCAARCAYCDFATAAIDRCDPFIARYAEMLSQQVAALSSRGLLEGAATAYVGGGTPTLAGGALVGLVGAVAAGAPSLIEFTSEANPESLDRMLADGLAAAGLTRLSLGVQSLDDRELARLGRVHDARRALEAARAATGAGLNLSCDLMCGIPLQDADSWERSLEGVVHAGATHVSCYPLALEEGTPLARAVESGGEEPPDEDLQADLMLVAHDVLAENGFDRYEVASYAAPGRRCLHNMAYWTGVCYVGLGHRASSMGTPRLFEQVASTLRFSVLDVSDGVSCTPGDRGAGVGAAAFLAAHPDCARVRWTVVDSAKRLASAWESGEALAVEAEALDARQAAAEDLMLAMRTVDGASPDLLARARLALGGARLQGAVRDALGRGLASFDAPTGSLRPTRDGWLLGNELFGLFWELAEPGGEGR